MLFPLSSENFIFISNPLAYIFLIHWSAQGQFVILRLLKDYPKSKDCGCLLVLGADIQILNSV